MSKTAKHELTCELCVADVGIATAIFLTLTQVGGAVGGAVAGGIWSSILPKRLRLRLPASSDADTLVPQIMSSLPFAMSFDKGTAIRDAIDAAYVDVQRVLNATAIALLVPGLVAVCWMRNVHLEREDQGPGSTGAVVLGTASKLHGQLPFFLLLSLFDAGVLTRQLADVQMTNRRTARRVHCYGSLWTVVVVSEPALLPTTVSINHPARLLACARMTHFVTQHAC